MLIAQLLHLFCTIDDLCKPIEGSLDARALGRSPTRVPSLATSEIITILVSFHLSHYRTFKRFYTECVLVHLRAEFPKAPSYQRFVELMPRTLSTLAGMVPRLFGPCTGISYIDSTPLAVCKNPRIASHRVFAGVATRGRTSVGWFFGLKLHVVINHLGDLLAVHVTGANRSDLAQVPFLTKRLRGFLFGDKGYIGKKMREELAGRGLKLVTKVRRNMKPQTLSPEERQFLRGRGLVETVVGLMKSVCQIEHSRHRSTTNFVTHLLSGIVAYCFLPEKPQITLRPDRKHHASGAMSVRHMVV